MRKRKDAVDRVRTVEKGGKSDESDECGKTTIRRNRAQGMIMYR